MLGLRVEVWAVAEGAAIEKGVLDLQELDEERQTTVHAHPGVLFPANFDHAAKAVQLLRWRVVVKLILWVKAEIVLVGTYPV